MVINAQMMFAKRVAEWMTTSELSQEEMTLRLSRFSDEFNNMVIQAARELRAA